MRIHHFHNDYDAPWLPTQILHTHCFQFLTGITDLSREIDAYAKYMAGLTRCINSPYVYVEFENRRPLKLQQNIEWKV